MEHGAQYDETGYGNTGQQRSFSGQSAQLPVARGPPPQLHNGFQTSLGYDECAVGGHEPQYRNQYPDPRYAASSRPSPPQGTNYGNAPRGGLPPQDGRGAGPPPVGRPRTSEASREPDHPPPGQGRGIPPMTRRGSGQRGPLPQHSNLDLQGGRQPTPGPAMAPPGNDLAYQMSAMNLSGPVGNGRQLGDSAQQAYQERDPSTWTASPQDYRDPRRGPPGQAMGGFEGYRDIYGPPNPAGALSGGPRRSMTMPPNSGPSGQAMPGPQRPATRAANQPPHDAPYPAGSGSAGQSFHGGINYSVDYGHNGQMDDFYGAYYSEEAYDDSEPVSHARNTSRSSMPDFDAIPDHGKRDSFAASMQPGSEQPQSVARQGTQLAHAKSMVEMRQPQTATYEMAGGIPDVPALPPMRTYQSGYGGPGGFSAVPPRQPSAPPGPIAQPGHSSNPPVRPNTATPQSSNPDALPAHPTPVRAGLMQGSVVNPNVKPPPVRNYSGLSQQQHHPPAQYQQPLPSPQQQQRPMPPQPMAGRSVPRQRQAEDNSPVTPQELERLRVLVRDRPNDQMASLQLAKRLMDASTTLVPDLADPRARARARDRYLVDAQKILKRLSQMNNSDAMFMLADSIGKGLFGNQPDQREAFNLYHSAAKLGHPGAAYRTAVCCEIGHEEGGGTRKDPMKAIQWYKRAATLGDPPAMYKVGMILLKGLLGQPRNPREAVGWLKRASEQADAENPHALHELGLLYESASGDDVIIRDEQYALSLFQQAAELGYKFSQFKLGCAYEYGSLGCPIDARQSIMWYSKAAMQEEHQAELALSGWYLTGSEGVLGQSDTEAYLWARKAALAGLAKAEYAMGYLTEVGIGTPADLDDAKRWYWRAASQDFPKARDRLEDLKKVGKGGKPRPRERISRSQPQEGECVAM